MKLKLKTLSDLADMIAGGPATTGWETESPAHPFPYRSGTMLSEFFQNLELEVEHSGSRIPWTKDLLRELNEREACQPDLPADILVAAILDVMDASEFDRSKRDRQAALEHLNKSLAREGLEAFFDEAGLCRLRAGSTTSVGSIRQGAWTKDELERRQEWQAYLRKASEDDFTSQVLVPMLRLVGFLGIQTAGHKDKALEYGKDLRMKYRLPTGHFLYFAIQVKKGKLDAAGRTTGKNESVTEVLNQVRMALDHEVFDPDVSRRCLIDHIYVVATGEITKQARNFLVDKLDREKRRQLIFMDRDELLDVIARINLPLPSGSSDLPF